MNMTHGRRAYEADVANAPNYPNGMPRCTWDELGEIERDSWERNPTPRFKQPVRPFNQRTVTIILDHMCGDDLERMWRRDFFPLTQTGWRARAHCIKAERAGLGLMIDQFQSAMSAEYPED